MIRQELLSLRLAQQQITRHDFQTIGEAAAWMGAMQAQDYAGAKWSLGLRLPGVTDADIERAIAEKSIVRTTSLRGTLHFLAAADVRWILKLLAPRVVARFAGPSRAAGLTKSDFSRSADAMIRALEGGQLLSRPELLQAVREGGVSVEGARPNYLLYRAALDGVICQGSRRGKEFMFALLDEWSPGECAFEGDAASAELARRYFQSHGPATVQDFAWWSGQSLGAARAGLEMVQQELESVTVEGNVYWMPDSIAITETASPVFLLPGFDEYMLGYTDRSLVIPEEQLEALTPKNGIFTPLVIMNGRAAGTWKRTLGRGAAVVEISPFEPQSAGQSDDVASAVRDYQKFIAKERPVVLK